MTSDRDQQIWALALAAEHDHGDVAEDHALSQARLATASGQATEAAMWEDVAALLHKLHSIGTPLRTIDPAGPRLL